MLRVRPWMLGALVTVAAGTAAALAAAAFAADGPKAFVQTETRTMSRIFLFGEQGPAGQYSIQYGSPGWKPEYDEGFAELTHGKRIRLGKDWWTTLENFNALTFSRVSDAPDSDAASPKTEIPEGSWFLALDCSAEGAWSLVVLDPAPIRKAKLDAFATENVTGGTLVPMTYDTVNEFDDRVGLAINFLPIQDKPLDHTLEIRFGKHRLRTVVTPKL